MARIRSVKPEFWKSPTIARLPHRTRLTFIALWSYVDDNGVGRDLPQVIAGELFALEDDPREALANVRWDLARLSEEGRITRYTVDGRPFLHVTGWEEHQRIDKPNKPRWPLPDDPAAVLTCGYGESRDTLATPSRESREVPAPGAVEQGNRGAEEQGSRENTLAQAAPERPTPFDAFWEVYPRRTGKKDARVAYDRACAGLRKEGRDPHATVLHAAEQFRDDPTRDPAFTPHPATWLNKGRWDDEGPARPHPRTELNSAEQRQARNLALVERFSAPTLGEQPSIEAPAYLDDAPGWGA